jgi:hypothetical protein
MSIITIQDNIYNWVHAVIPSLSCIWVNENFSSKEVSKSFIGMKLLNITTIGTDHKSNIILSHKIAKLSVTVTAMDASAIPIDTLVTLCNSLRLTEVSSTIRKSGIIIDKDSDITDVSNSFDGKFEKKANVEFNVRWAEEIIDDAETISAVNIDESLTSDRGTNCNFTLQIGESFDPET